MRFGNLAFQFFVGAFFCFGSFFACLGFGAAFFFGILLFLYGLGYGVFAEAVRPFGAAEENQEQIEKLGNVK